mmetsp:Transcript_44056/g.79050  ORF Transcript_44056/g.79050 Transcript_44056/m.79050 type:complete len:425 (-) Transcript_44056:524-1798(-)|eukprot:CAMPEP_0201886424 /NCGR_PEP_ID=MMETSP0902-20130614/22039_1 /ASSEMBLY_ACC=CAM_ASM_000551 /TAXON_ID=420261 /ORGANISM="Thalassiosira antarctica, Strain CCMP982" /LENGTH=424 /DNA_ID=CAMNT_0048415995 /DNA_START=76 /DNA_END=1350 /DNA_ORIENTATION=-
MSSSLKYVDHTYRDFSRYIDEGGQLIKHKKCEANFPAKLHKMLSESTHSDVITWMPHGRAWKILDKDLLFSSVIPQYFVCKKYESFTRQLNGWGFKRLHQSGNDLGCYYHECFLRDLPKLTCLIRRLSANQGKSTPYPAGEPNFYRISETYPLPPLTPSEAAARKSAAEAAATKSAEIQNPSSTSMEPSTQESLAVFASVASAAVPSHGLEPSTRESIAVLAAASSLAAPSREHSNEVQYLSSSSIRPLTQEYSVGLAATSTMPYETSYQMPRYTQEYHYPQPTGHSSYSNAPNYLPSFGHSGQQYYGQYSTQGQPPQYQYQSPPQPFQPPQYHHYPPTQNGAPIKEHLPLANYSQQSHGSGLSAGRSVPPSSDCLTNQDGNKSSLDQSSRQENRSPIIEPLPCSTMPDHEVRKGCGSPGLKTN